MVRAIVTGFVGFLCVVVASYAVAEGEDAPGGVLISQLDASGSLSTAPAVIRSGGRLLTLYPNGQGRIVLRRGEKSATLDDDAPTKGGGYCQLHDAGGTLYALWWVKGKGGKKQLYLRASSDHGKSFGPLKVLNHGGGVLPRYTFIADDSGRLTVAFLDERNAPSYRIYANASIDGGDTWLQQDVRIDTDPVVAVDEVTKKSPAGGGGAAAHKQLPRSFAVNPRLVFLGNRALLIWQQQDYDNRRPILRWLARTSEDGGRSWSLPKEIHRQANKTPFELTLIEHEGRAYAFTFVKGLGLLGFRSDPEGGAWANLGVAPGAITERTVLSTIRAAAGGGSVLVAYVLEQQGQKDRVYVSRLSFSSGKWQGQPWRLDRKDHELTRADWPELLSLSNGGVVAVWQDYRYLLPAIYLDYTTDGGANWLERPLPMTDLGQYTVEFPQLLHAGDDRVILLFDRVDKEMGRTVRSLAYRILPAENARDLVNAAVPNAYEQLSHEEKVKRLKKRMEELWSLRAQGKFEQTWDYLDPAYRNGFRNKYSWLARQANMSYSNFAILAEPEISGAIGKVAYTVTVTMPQQVIGEMITEASPPEEIPGTMRWGWFVDDWYSIPETMLHKHLDY